MRVIVLPMRLPAPPRWLIWTALGAGIVLRVLAVDFNAGIVHGDVTGDSLAAASFAREGTFFISTVPPYSTEPYHYNLAKFGGRTGAEGGIPPSERGTPLPSLREGRPRSSVMKIGAVVWTTTAQSA